MKNRRMHQEQSVSSFSQLFNCCSGNIFVNAKLSSSYLSPLGNFSTNNPVMKSSLHTITSSLVPYIDRHGQIKRRLGTSVGCHITRFSNIPHLQRKEASEAMWVSRVKRFNSEDVNTLPSEKLSVDNKNMADSLNSVSNISDSHINNKVFDPLKRSQYFREKSVLQHIQNKEADCHIEQELNDECRVVEISHRSEGETFVSQIIGFQEFSDRYENLSRGENIQACQYNDQNTGDISGLQGSNLCLEVFQCGTNSNIVTFSLESKNNMNGNLEDHIVNSNSTNTNKNMCRKSIVLPHELKNDVNNGKTKSLVQNTKLSFLRPFNFVKLEDLYDHNFERFPSKWCFAEEPRSVIQRSNMIVDILSKDKINTSVLENIAFDGSSFNSLCIRQWNDQGNLIRVDKHPECPVFQKILHVKVENFQEIPLRFNNTNYTADFLPLYKAKEYGESVYNQTLMEFSRQKMFTEEGIAHSIGASMNKFTMRRIFYDPKSGLPFSKLTGESNAGLLTSVVRWRNLNNAEPIGATDQPSLNLIFECTITMKNVPLRVSPNKMELFTSRDVRRNRLDFNTYAQKPSELAAVVEVELEDNQLNEYRHSFDPNIDLADLFLNPDEDALLENCITNISDLSVVDSCHQITKQKALVINRIMNEEYFYLCQKYFYKRRKGGFPLNLLPSLRFRNSLGTINNKILMTSVKKKFKVKTLILDKYSVVVKDETTKSKFSNLKSCKKILNNVEQCSKSSSTSGRKLCPLDIDLQSCVSNHRFNNLLLKVLSLLEKNSNKYVQNNGSQSEEIRTLLSCRNRIGFTVFSCVLYKSVQLIAGSFSRTDDLDTHVTLLLDNSHIDTVRNMCENFTARCECLSQEHSLDFGSPSSNGKYKNIVSVYKSSIFDRYLSEYHRTPNDLNKTMLVLNFKEIFKDLGYDDFSIQLSYDELKCVMYFLANFSKSEENHFSVRTGLIVRCSSNIFPLLHHFVSQNGSKSLSKKKEKEVHFYNSITKKFQCSLLFLLRGNHANLDQQIIGYQSGIHRNGKNFSECPNENECVPNLREERPTALTKISDFRKDDFCTLLGNYGVSLSCFMKEQEIPVTRGKGIYVSERHFLDGLQMMRLLFKSNLCTELILRFECCNAIEESHGERKYHGFLPQLPCETDKKSYRCIAEHDEEPVGKSSEITESKSTLVATLQELSPLNSLSSNCSCNSLCSCNFSDTINSDLSMSSSSLDIVTALTEAPSITPDQSVDYYSFSSPVLGMEDPYLSLSDIPESQNCTFCESQSLNLSDLSYAVQEQEASEDDLDLPPSHNSQMSETGLNPYLKICFSSSESVASVNSNSNGICSSCGSTSQVSFGGPEPGQPTSAFSYNPTLSRTSSPCDSKPSAQMEIYVCAECKFNLQNPRNVHNDEQTSFAEGIAESVHLSTNIHFDSDLIWEENLSPITSGNVSMHILGEYKFSLSFAQAEDSIIKNKSSNNENCSVNVSLDCSTECEEECNFVSIENGIVGYKSKKKKMKPGGKIENENIELQKNVTGKENNILKENVDTIIRVPALEEVFYPHRSVLSGQLVGRSQSCHDLSLCEKSINGICREEISFNAKVSSPISNHALQKEKKEIPSPIVKSISLDNLCVNEAKHASPVPCQYPIQRRRTYDTFFIDGEHIFAVLTPERDFCSKSAANNMRVPQILSDNSDIELLASSPSYESDERNFAEYINSLNYSPISLPSGSGTDISSLSSLPSDRLPLSDIDLPVVPEHN